MLKPDKDIKKRWFSFAFFNLAFIILIFGALIAGFSVYAVNAQTDALRDDVREYAEMLSTKTRSELEAACEDGLPFEENRPNLSFALYVRRSDGSLGMVSDSAFITDSNPPFEGRLNTFRTEEAGGLSFITYTVMPEGESDCYVKVFAANDWLVAADREIRLYCIPFAVCFVVIAAAFSFIWGYVSIKPIVSTYIKQKNVINDMSHEIRTPLAVIKGNIENALAAPDARVEDVRELLETCLGEVDYMNDMSSGLLNIVKGQGKSVKKEDRLGDVVSRTVDMFADLATMGNKSLVANIESCEMAVDGEKVRQLVSVLLDNAVKYTRDGDRITVRLKNLKEGCVLTVSDTGIGVPKNELELIFDRFYRGENVKDLPGTGLGLSIAQSIAEGMGATIRAANNVPCGLEITVHFKRA